MLSKLVMMSSLWLLSGLVAVTPLLGFAQDGFGQRPPEFQSVEVDSARQVTFRMHAPKGDTVRLSSSDIPNRSGPGGLEMKKGENGIWEVTTSALPGGAYRYSFNVDGITVIDPKNPSTSQSNENSWSLVTVPGSEYSDLRDVPHGAVSQVTYHSKSLHRFRRMHVYTPPGYEAGTDRFPVLYLLHGAFDADASWNTVGQAGQILDNLIADGKAKPMIVVMPMGHTGPFSFGPNNSFEKQMSEFEEDFKQDVRPTIEGRYRVLGTRGDRALAGLSMGGAQTLNVGMANLADYGYLGVFSSGVFGIDRGTETGAGQAWMSRHAKMLDDKEARRGLRLMWFATGNEDFLLETSRATVKTFKDHGFDVTYQETEGGHTWLNWRDYLRDFAQQLFQD